MRIPVRGIEIMCDCCENIFEDGDGYASYINDEDGKRIQGIADSSGWISLGDKDYCPECWRLDKNDHIVTKDGHIFDYDTEEEMKGGEE